MLIMVLQCIIVVKFSASIIHLAVCVSEIEAPTACFFK